MKHILGMVKPHLDSAVARPQRVELDYVRLIYAVGEIRRQGETAQGYFVATSDNMLNRLSQLERGYHGKEYARILSVSLDGYLTHMMRAEKTEILSGMVRAAILDKSDGAPSEANRRRMREFILGETIRGLEPDVQQVNDENRFPFRIRWDYYGVVESGSGADGYGG